MKGLDKMIPVKLEELKIFINRLVSAAGMNPENSEIFTDVYIRSTLRGVGHHDIYDLNGRISSFVKKIMNVNPEIKIRSGNEALESYDGDNGPGELCCSFIMKRSIKRK